MRAFLLCCGPSIKYQNLSCLEGETCVSVSNFFVHPLINNIAPKYHIFAPIHEPITSEMTYSWFSEADDKLPPETTILMDEKDISIWNQLNSQRYFNTYSAHSILYQSVSQIALALMLHLLPFKENSRIYLLGCDHNWIRHVGQTRHFYSKEESVLERKGYDEWFGQEINAAREREAQCNANLFNIYEQYKQHALNRQITIYNATPGSRLKTYPSTDLFNIFEEPTMDNI